MRLNRTPVEVLREARRLLTEKGWVRGIESVKVGNEWHYCLLGAIKTAGDGTPALQAVKDAINRTRAAAKYRNRTGRDRLTIIRFNDMVAKDKRAVIRVLDSAIAKLEKGRNT